MAPALLPTALLVLAVARIADGSSCDASLQMSTVAKVIGSRVSKAARKFGCPVPLSAACAADGCELVLDTSTTEAQTMPRSCDWQRLVLGIGAGVRKRRAAAERKFGCDAAQSLHCAPVDGWWSCGAAAIPLLRRGRSTSAGASPDASAPAPGAQKPGGACDEDRLLGEIAEELGEALGRSCDFVVSVVCPALDAPAGSSCRFGTAAAETRRCERSVLNHASAEVMEELREGKRFGCPTTRQTVCAAVAAAPGRLRCSFLSPSPSSSPPRMEREL